MPNRGHDRLPLVSVFMKNYNYGVFIGEAIESVLGQDFEDLELIIVDDASTDASREIIESYQEQDGRVRTIFHDLNLGIPRVANDGIEAARGKYIAQMDSDDVWVEDKLTRQLDAMAYDDNRLIWSEGEVIDDKGQSLAKTFSELQNSVSRKKSGNIFEELLKGNYIFSSSLMYKKANLGDIRYDERLTFASDYKFVLDLARKYEFHYISAPLAQYRIHAAQCRIHAGSMWQREGPEEMTRQRQTFADLVFIHQEALRQYSSEIPEPLKADMYATVANMYALIAWYSMLLGQYREGLRSYVQAIKSNPWSWSNPVYVALVVITMLRGSTAK
jgi:teichuronic acid biosynthesis glycosyltransferase TuaG